MTDPVEESGLIVSRVRSFLQLVRYGRREQAWFAVGSLLFAAAILRLELPEPLSRYSEVWAWVRTALYACGGLCWSIAGWGLWRRALPPPFVKEDISKPTSIKGPMAFGEQDWEIFSKLGRNRELETLLGYVLDDQVPLVVMIGESGAGKTSLLRAGLTSYLKPYGTVLVYWEALPTNPAEGLLKTISSRWQDTGDKPANLDEAINCKDGKRRVIVLDQFEQLSMDSHPEIFALLSSAVQRSAPFQTTWVIAFRDEFAAQWLDFAQRLGRIPPMLVIKRFSVSQAKQVMATLADDNHLDLSNELVSAVLEGNIDRTGISPVDIGISMLVLSEMSSRMQGPQLNIDEYRDAGGQAGILSTYIRNRLEPLLDEDRQKILQGLLTLVEDDKDQRLAEGRDTSDIARTGEMPDAKMARYLEYLSSSQVRLLEKVAEKRYPACA